MNLFICDTSPTRIAESLADRHVVKMGLEAAQLLCTATKDPRYRPTHPKHPCTRWVEETRENAAWTQAYGLAICAEYTFRYGRVHACEAVLRTIQVEDLPSGSRTPFVFVGLPEFFRRNSIVESYRALLLDKYTRWGEKARWTKRTPPPWAKPISGDPESP
jgi:hypothetical protein